ncbi:MAG: ATP-dependent Clp protease, ATP-binding subunit ClpC [Planctomycetaceae bacterium]|nr:ATP-dependent Clp protease, ATP-binding subunit ClpC [Planctomycetaceae bacterium]
MLSRCTDRARKILELANKEAHYFQREYIETEHVLLGMLIEGKGVAGAVLKHLGIELIKVRWEIERTAAPDRGTVPLGQLPFAPLVRKVIECAYEEAKKLDHNYIGGEHLLLSLVRARESVAVTLLTGFGLTTKQVRTEVLEILGMYDLAAEDSPSDIHAQDDSIWIRRATDEDEKTKKTGIWKRLMDWYWSQPEKNN